jgi:hypothetical protein
MTYRDCFGEILESSRQRCPIIMLIDADRSVVDSLELGVGEPVKSEMDGI